MSGRVSTEERLAALEAAVAARPELPDLVPVKVAAAALAMTPRELLRRARAGEIGCVKVSGTPVVYERQRNGQAEALRYERTVVRFRLSDLHAWMAARYAPATVPPPAPAVEAGEGRRANRFWETLPAAQRRFS